MTVDCQLLTLKEIAKAAEVKERTIRFWTQRGLLPDPIRVHGRGNLNFYNQSHADCINLIKGMRSNSSLDSIKNTIGRNELSHIDFGGQIFNVVATIGLFQGNSGKTVTEYKLLEDGGMLAIIRKKELL